SSPRRSAKRWSACCSARGSPSRCWTRPQRRWIASSRISQTDATRAMRQWYRLAFPRNHLERRKRAGFLFVLPAWLFFGAVFILPLAQSVLYSFYKIVPGGAREFVGL